MKFEINAREFKNLFDKVAATAPKKSVVPILETVRITGGNGELTMAATDTVGYIIVFDSDVTIMEPGICHIDIDTMKRITKLKASVLTINHDVEEEKLIVETDKGKRVTFPNHWGVSEFPSMPMEDDVLVYESSAMDFLDMLEKLEPCVSKSETNKIMMGYCLDFKNHRVVALDGHRVTWRNINCIKQKGISEIIIPWEVLPQLKKVLKSDGDIQISASHMYATISSDDFMYTTRLIDGKYFDISNFVDVGAKTKQNFVLSRDNLKEVMEYDTVQIRESCKRPVIFSNDTDKVIAKLSLSDMEIEDVLETESNNLEDGFRIGFNPRFIVDACKVLDDGEMVRIDMWKENTPGYFRNIDVNGNYGDYTVMLLPVNIKGMVA